MQYSTVCFAVLQKTTRYIIAYIGQISKIKIKKMQKYFLFIAFKTNFTSFASKTRIGASEVLQYRPLGECASNAAGIARYTAGARSGHRQV